MGISDEEQDIKWDIAFAATPREREIAEEKLKEFFIKQKSCYKEK